MDMTHPAAVITKKTSTASIYGFEVLMGIGGGCQAQTGYAVLQALIDPSQVSQALGIHDAWYVKDKLLDHWI